MNKYLQVGHVLLDCLSHSNMHGTQNAVLQEHESVMCKLSPVEKQIWLSYWLNCLV
jgi:hypothetical protein